MPKAPALDTALTPPDTNFEEQYFTDPNSPSNKESSVLGIDEIDGILICS